MTARHENHDSTVCKESVLLMVLSNISLYPVTPMLLNQQIWNKQKRVAMSKYLSRQTMPSGRLLRLAGRKGREKKDRARTVVSQVIFHNRVRGCKYQLFLVRSWADSEIYCVWETAAAKRCASSSERSYSNLLFIFTACRNVRVHISVSTIFHAYRLCL